MGKSLRNLLTMLPIILALTIIGLALFIPIHATGHENNVTMILKTSAKDNDFWLVVEYGARTAAKDYGVNLSIRGPSSETALDEQNALIDSAVKEKPDAIVLAPISYDLSVPAAKAVKNAGLPLVVVDSKIRDDIADCTVATDNIAAGRQLGQLVEAISPQGSTIGVISHVKDSSTAKDRLSGLTEVLSAGRYSIVGPYYSNSNREQARLFALEMLKAHPEIKVIVGLNEWSATGAGQAVKDAGLTGKVKIVGFDNSQLEAQFMEQGVFYGVVVQKAFNMGYLSVEAAAKLARRKPVEQHIDSGSVKIIDSNLYTKENQKLMFPFIEN